MLAYVLLFICKTVVISFTCTLRIMLMHIMLKEYLLKLLQNVVSILLLTMTPTIRGLNESAFIWKKRRGYHFAL